MSKLFERLNAGQTAVGVWIKGGPVWVNTLARAGFDFVRPDMMFSAIDWRELDHIHRTALSVGLTTWVRVTTSVFRVLMTCGEVFAGANKAYQLSTSYPG